MRAIFGILSLLIVVAVIGILAKKQLGGHATAVPATTTAEASAPVVVPRSATLQQGRQVQQQTQQALEAAMQQAQRAAPQEQ